MYDDLLSTDLGGNALGYSSASLVAFADDVAVVAMGCNKEALEDTTNRALSVVAEWMYDKNLCLAAHKTEAGILTTKRGYGKPVFTVNGLIVDPKESLRYLGVELGRKLGFKQHIDIAAAKAGATAEALARILLYVGGARQRSKKILTTAVHNQLLYAAPIWAEALVFENNIKTLERPQRKMALRVAMAYRTVSTNAIMVVGDDLE